ncbi:MAG: TetR/AcrR family transcriptional regulator C-terminal domain-containing protein [Eubacteriales bacterium]|nr:TetR/AcrR family transcriptional regulator C-terminal domain-containing protein [Eubacteriales bacterium]
MPKNNKLGCSYSTQLKLANSLKELMSTQSLEKLSVSDITNHCSLHRQTFYYHFDDKYELLDWIVYKELIEPLVDGFTFDNMYDRFIMLFTTMVEEKKFYLNALKIDVDDMSRYISRLAYEQFMIVIDCIEKNTGVKSDHEENVMFAEFLGYGFVGLVFGWAQRGMKDSPEVMTKRLERIINNLKHIALESNR